MHTTELNILPEVVGFANINLKALHCCSSLRPLVSPLDKRICESREEGQLCRTHTREQTKISDFNTVRNSNLRVACISLLVLTLPSNDLHSYM